MVAGTSTPNKGNNTQFSIGLKQGRSR